MSLGAVGFAVGSAGAFLVTQKLDPSLASLTRNQTIASALVAVAGVGLAVKGHPLLGVGLAAGGFVIAAGTPLLLALNGILSGGSKSIGAVFSQMGGYKQMGAYRPMGAVYSQMGAYRPQLGQGMGAVYSQMGNFVPQAPWAANGNPF